MALVFRDITELTKIKQEMERLAHTDFLTGLYNRRFFMQRLAEETERVKRGHQPMSVLLLDMDGFKTVNDTHGHDVGDRVLQVIASVTQEVKRISDVSARIGGEEFAMLLPDTDREGAIKLAQRLRRTINEQIIADAKGPVPISGETVRFEVNPSKYSRVLLPPLVTEPSRTAPIEPAGAVSVSLRVPLTYSWSVAPDCQTTSIRLLAALVRLAHVALAVAPTWICTSDWPAFIRYRTWNRWVVNVLELAARKMSWPVLVLPFGLK